MERTSLMDFVEEILAGKVFAISKMISLVERRDPKAFNAMKQLYGKCGRAHIIGVTGPPGAGKSCLVAALVRQFRKKGLSVGVLAVDPSSPFTGGAVLGDRARMEEFSSDPEVFIRSLATRGSVGGLSEAVNGAVDIFDAAGKDIILIETVGVGQNEIDIVNLAHTVVLALVPGYGDWLQAMKAGIMEVGDILVVNKADQPGAGSLLNELCLMPGKTMARDILDNADVRMETWRVPVGLTTAIKGEGTADLASIISMHFQFLKIGNGLSEKNRERRINQFLDLLSKRMREEFVRHYQTDPALRGWIEKIKNLKLDPYQASEQVIDFIVEAREGKIRNKRPTNKKENNQ
jgi:LAO/AO transport system kinase